MFAFLFFRMGNFTSSFASPSGPGCSQYVQVRCCGVSVMVTWTLHSQTSMAFAHIHELKMCFVVRRTFLSISKIETNSLVIQQIRLESMHTYNGRTGREHNNSQFRFVWSFYLNFCFISFQEVVSHNCIVIFSKTTCPFCRMAKDVFNEIGANYKVIELDEHNDGRRMQEALAHMTGARTVRMLPCYVACIGNKVTMCYTFLWHNNERLYAKWNTCLKGTSSGVTNKYNL